MKAKLLQLLNDNRRRAPARAARIEQKAKSSEATLYLYDTIVSDQWMADYWGGVCPQDLVPQIDALEADVIHVRINSPGGDVFAGQAIAAALERHSAKCIAHVDGLAASAATAIAVACDEIRMADGAMFMIHNAWTIAIGDKNDFLDVAGLLEKIDGTLAKGYADFTGKPLAELKKLMDEETWFTAEEAVEFGFATKVEEEAESEEDAKAAWNLSAFAKAPKADKPTAPAAPEQPSAEDGARRARLADAQRRGKASALKDPVAA
jgi:ATP-dependent Clp protease protease subunit